MEFKIGEEVRIIGGASGNTFIFGDIVTIMAIDNNRKFAYKCKKGAVEAWVLRNDIEPLNESNIGKFKIGEEVRLIDSFILSTFYENGTICKIIDIRFDSTLIILMPDGHQKWVSYGDYNGIEKV